MTISMKRLLSIGLLGFTIITIPIISQAHEREYKDNHYQKHNSDYGYRRDNSRDHKYYQHKLSHHNYKKHNRDYKRYNDKHYNQNYRKNSYKKSNDNHYSRINKHYTKDYGNGLSKKHSMPGQVSGLYIKKYYKYY